MRIHQSCTTLFFTLLAGLNLFAQPVPPVQTHVAAIGAASLKAPATADFAVGATFTMEGWVYLTGSTPFGWVMGKGLAEAGVDPFVSFTLQLDATGTKLVFATSTGAAGSFQEIVSPSVLALREWTHVAGVMDNGVTRLYVNGELVASGTTAGAPISAPAVAFGIGSAFLADGNTNYPAFPGYARQVRFWNVARTTAQITAALTQSLPAERNGLIAAWPLDETSGASARDISGNNRALTGGSWVRRVVLESGPFFAVTSHAAPEGVFSNVDDGALIDFDSDGDLDLVTTHIHWPATVPETRLRLRAFRNVGGVFSDATDAVLGEVTMVHPRHSAIRDFNGDGRADLLVIGHGTDTPPYPGEQTKLLIQSVDGRLVDESATRLPQRLTFTHNVAVGDVDGDADLDIFMANINGGTAGPMFYLNNGAGVFSDASDRLPAEIAARSEGLAFASAALVDVNDDEHPDLVLGGENSSPTNLILLNNGAGYFAPDARFALPPKLFGPTAVTVAVTSADLNADGAVDLVMSTTGGEIVMPEGHTIGGYQFPGVQLLLNRGDGTFADATAQLNLTFGADDTWVEWVRIVDFNDDGWLDLVLQGAPSASGQAFSRTLLLNVGNAVFVDASEAYAGGAVTFLHPADVDGDGTVDLVGAGSSIEVSRGTKVLDLAIFRPESGAPVFSESELIRISLAGGGAQLSVAGTVSGTPTPSYQWTQNGRNVSGATAAELTFATVQPAQAGIYRATAVNAAGASSTEAAIVGAVTTSKVLGDGLEVGTDILHANKNIFDQVLLTGAAEAITADYTANQITRTSYIDLNGDIVQVEFSGPGTLSLVLDGASGPAGPEKYNQAVSYMKGHAGIVITGADERTNVSVFTVGRVTAGNQTLFHDDVTYDGFADIAFIAIETTNGKFGGVRASNTHFFADRGMTGIYAPGVAFQGPLFVGNITAFGTAVPVLITGSTTDARVTGGDMLQDNAAAVQVSGISRLAFTDGSDSHGQLRTAQQNRAVFISGGETVTDEVVVDPAP